MQRASVEARAAAIYYPAMKISGMIKGSHSILSARTKYATITALSMACSDASASALGDTVGAHPYALFIGAALGITGWVALAATRVKMSSKIDRLSSSLNTAQTDLSSAQKNAADASTLRDLYLDGILSMKMEDKKGFLSHITAQVIDSETPENLAKLMSPFPEETADMIGRLALENKWAQTPKNILAIVQAMYSPSLDISSRQVRYSDILWAIAEHENAPPSAVANLLSSLKRTHKVIDQPGKHHKERDWCAKEKTVYVIVDVEEKSHWEYEPEEITRMHLLLSKKPGSFLARISSDISLKLWLDAFLYDRIRSLDD